ncbi:MAG: nuclear transport factor 2 family protein [Acidobacteria bacterium]|nr:nuclear transport factor 2 family protein [Acidobacteriota bacterium]
MKKYALILILLLTAAAASAQQKNTFVENTEITQDVATKYFNNYMAIDWDALGSLMHDEISFDDATADLLFGEKKPVGKANVLKNFRDTFVAITNMTPKLSRTFFSGDVGVFEMDLSFSFKNRQNGLTTIEMPLVVVITVKDGKVIEHRDYGDYREYIKQLRAAQAKANT